jgi:phosphoglycolate phosphatase-like HAD superfamily hydrolase
MKKEKKKYKALILDVDGTLIPNKRDGMPSKKVTDSIASALKTSSNFIEVRLSVGRVLEETKRKHVSGRVGYVSGIISSDGDEKILKNITRLENYTNDIRKIHKFPIFNPPDIFSDDLYARLQELKVPKKEREEKFIVFWREILTSGHITDIFMTPRWRESRGAQDEHKTALRVGIRIHYVNIQM